MEHRESSEGKDRDDESHREAKPCPAPLPSPLGSASIWRWQERGWIAAGMSTFTDSPSLHPQHLLSLLQFPERALLLVWCR